jgi:hypothetical protein
MAFDIAMVNTPLKTVREISKVLQRMSAAGDILVIAERHQLVFPRRPTALPSRLVQRGLHASGHRAAVLDAA